MSTTPDQPRMDPRDNPMWWVFQAACCPEDGPAIELEELFVDAGKSISKETYETCVACPVRLQCLKWAYDEQVKSGYFGGVSYGVRRNHSFEDLVALIDDGRIGRGGRVSA
jgi:hypothetical protein